MVSLPMTLNDPKPKFQGHTYIYHWECRKGYEIRTCFTMKYYALVKNDLERLREIFSDTKQRAASLRQLSFLYDIASVIQWSVYCSKLRRAGLCPPIGYSFVTICLLPVSDLATVLAIRLFYSPCHSFSLVHSLDSTFFFISIQPSACVRRRQESDPPTA